MSSLTRGRAPSRVPKLHQPMVFVIEDNADTRAGLRDGLESNGFAVFATGDGQDALDHLRTERKPDALVLDLYMPGLSGFEIYQVLHSDPQLATIPVIVVTAASPVHRTGLDVAATIRKPLDVQELLITVRRAVAGGSATPSQNL